MYVHVSLGRVPNAERGIRSRLIMAKATLCEEAERGKAAKPPTSTEWSGKIDRHSIYLVLITPIEYIDRYYLHLMAYQVI